VPYSALLLFILTTPLYFGLSALAYGSFVVGNREQHPVFFKIKKPVDIILVGLVDDITGSFRRCFGRFRQRQVSENISDGQQPANEGVSTGQASFGNAQAQAQG
jgi:hypothetical protein